MTAETISDDVVHEFGPLGRFLTKFLIGDFGLAKTYWLFGVLGGALYGVLSAGLVLITESLGVAICCMYFAFFYVLFVSGAIWDAATKYKGDPVWSILAKASVLFSAVSYFANVYLALSFWSLAQ